jgi:hypothetical protein
MLDQTVIQVLLEILDLVIHQVILVVLLQTPGQVNPEHLVPQEILVQQEMLDQELHQVMLVVPVGQVEQVEQQTHPMQIQQCCHTAFKIFLLVPE